MSAPAPPGSPPATPRPSRPWVRGLVDYAGLVGLMLGYVVERWGLGHPSSESLVLATWWLMGGSVVGLATGLLVERRIAPLPLVGGVVALVFGSLTLVNHDTFFIQIKPTLINLTFAAALFGGRLMKKNPLKLLLGDALKLTDRGWRTLSLRYGLFFCGMAAANEFVRRTQSEGVWTIFRTAGLPGMAVLFSLTQVPLMMQEGKAAEAELAELAARAAETQD